MSSFYPRQMTYVKKDDTQYALVFQDIIDKINAQAQKLTELEARIKVLEG